MTLDTTLPYVLTFEAEQQPAPVVGIHGTGWVRGAVSLADRSVVLLLDDLAEDMTTRAAATTATHMGIQTPIAGYLLSLN